MRAIRRLWGPGRRRSVCDGVESLSDQTTIILTSGIISLLLSVVAGAVAGAVFQQFAAAPLRMQLRVLDEEISKLWETVQGEIRRQAVRSSRSNTSRGGLQQAASFQSSTGESSLSEPEMRDRMLAEFERRGGRG